MDIVARLDELAKRASKISDTGTKEATKLLLDFFSSNGDVASTADYIMKLKDTVCLDFFEYALSDTSTERIKTLHESVRATSSYKQKGSQAGARRGFTIAAVLIKHRHEYALEALVKTLADVERDGKFSDTIVNYYKKIVINYCGADSVKALANQDWDKVSDRNRFDRIMRAVDSSIVRIISAPKSDGNTNMKSPSGSPMTTLPSPIIQTSTNEPYVAQDSRKIDSGTIALASELLTTLVKSSHEAQSLHHTLVESNGTITLLREQVSNRDSQIYQKTAELRERDRQISDLHSDCEEAKRVYEDQKARIAELTEQLRTTIHMGEISQNQELFTLKTDIANSLKLEYFDYLKDKDAECDPDKFEAFRNSLHRVFRKLKRFGIVIDEEMS